MSKEIKFKFWDVSAARMLSWEEALNIMEENGCADVMFEYRNSWIPLQYIGLKDKHGKEIYEGDIVDLHNQNHLVVFDSWFCSFQFLELFLRPGLWVKQYARLCELNCIQYEVIGNKFENPELLEGINER